MKMIFQGMRRSGTTIVYDALSQDQDLQQWYEPLAAAKKPAIGGGSGVRDVDVFTDLRAARQTFLQEHRLNETDILNFGAPRDASLEFSPGLPHVVEEYLRFLLEQPGLVAAKFTRIYAKVREIYRLFPTAGFVHLVRDPLPDSSGSQPNRVASGVTFWNRNPLKIVNNYCCENQ